MNGAILQKRCNLHPCCKLCHAIDLIPDSLGIIQRRRQFFDFLTLSPYKSVVFYSFSSAIFYSFFIFPPLQNADFFMNGPLLTSTRVPKCSADAAWSRRDSLQSEHTRPICRINRQIKLFTRLYRTLKVTLPDHFCYNPVSKRHTALGTYLSEDWIGQLQIILCILFWVKSDLRCQDDVRPTKGQTN